MVAKVVASGGRMAAKLMRVDRTGASRIVILTRRYAIKIPNFRDDWPRLFCRGICANMQEVNFAITGWPELCPVLFSLPWGLLLVMPRLRLLTDDEFVEHIPEGWTDRGDYVIPVEMKSNSFGWLDQRPVAIDYGDW